MKEKEWSRGQIKTCRKKQHVKIDDMKGKENLICGKVAVGRNYNLTRDNQNPPSGTGSSVSASPGSAPLSGERSEPRWNSEPNWEDRQQRQKWIKKQNIRIM